MSGTSLFFNSWSLGISLDITGPPNENKENGYNWQVNAPMAKNRLVQLHPLHLLLRGPFIRLYINKRAFAHQGKLWFDLYFSAILGTFGWLIVLKMRLLNYAMRWCLCSIATFSLPETDTKRNEKSWIEKIVNVNLTNLSLYIHY